MSDEILTPEKIWIITGETYARKTDSGSRGSGDRGGFLGDEDETLPAIEIVVSEKKAVEVAKLKREMKGFLQAMREMLEEAEQPGSKIQLNEVELSVEINGEGQVCLFGVGGKVGGKGTMTFKFKRKDG
jgi:hypothetical protein